MASRDGALGVVGVGSIAEAIVEGLCAGADTPALLLSPRNAERAARLAARHAGVAVASDAQAVLDGAGTILVCVRPADAQAVLAPLRFRPEHRVVSVMAGVSAARLLQLCGPAGVVARAIPLPAVAERRGLTPVWDAAAAELFRPLGGVVELEDEATFEVFSAASGTVAAHFSYLDAIAGWMAAHGAPRDGADRFVAEVFAALDYTLHGRTLGELGRAHTTPGGINALMDARLRDAGLPRAAESALDAVLARLTRG